ncbi:hypothetical protein [uncultured Enterovirga sp.]|uniref:hypothetical protein n=1 Tax=uncultured Enterovirga sp. TaxID=2026352 RepID=UPI0035C9B876
MPLAGQGMLMTSMDVDPEHERELNLWYDREHIAERVAIPGFLEARRYVAEDARPKYLGLYSTAAFEDLSSEAYRRALANQTEWSRTNLARFRNMGRAVARITASRGQGRGAALAILRLRPQSGLEPSLRERLVTQLDPGRIDDVISMHLLESDPGLSVSLTEPDAPNPGAADWYVLIEGTRVEAVTSLADEHFTEAAGQDAETVSQGTYRLMWDLARSDL